MRYLRTNTATIVTVGPFLDKTDGVTLETGLTITNERISATVDLNDGSAPTLVLDNVTGATSGTSNDLNYITNCDAGLMQLELSAANTNYLGRFYLTITDAANHCPVFHEFMILPANVYDSIILGTDALDVSAIQFAGQTITCSGGVTVPAATLASTTNITAAAGCAVSSIGNNVITTASINDGAITEAKIADGAIDAATFAANSITASALATDAVNEIVGAVWDEVLDTAHEGAGSASVLLQGAGSAGDPWTTAIPGAYGAGSAGYILGTNLNAPVGTVDTVVDGIATTLGVAGAGLTALASATELAKVPKSDSNVTWNATALASINAEVDSALNTAIPGSPTADSINERIASLDATIGAAGAGLSAIPWNAAWDTEVQSECTDALNAYDPPTNAEMELRTLPAADYTVVSDLGTVQTGDTFALANGVSGFVAIKGDTAAILVDTGTDGVVVATNNDHSGFKKNVALSNFTFGMVLSSDHVSPADSKTLTEEISKDGGAFAACTNNATFISSGVYKIDLTQTEMNADIVVLRFTEADCDQRVILIKTSS